jgi:hypothetical protein
MSGMKNEARHDRKCAPFQEGFIKLYEFGFVILASVFANLLTSQLMREIAQWWLLREIALFFASWNTFQIYRRLDPKWQKALREHDAIDAYRGDFERDELNELWTRLFLVLAFLLEAVICTGLRLAWST